MSPDDLLERILPLANGGDSACLNGTPMIPLHRNTVGEICDLLVSLKSTSRICGYPLPGWRLDHVRWDERKGQPDGWIVSLHRERPDWHTQRRSTCVMARSDVGPLEAWDEALRIALREDAREVELTAARQAEAEAEKETQS